MTPSVTLSPSCLAEAEVTLAPAMPIKGLVTWPCSIKLSMIGLAIEELMAKPIPCAWPWRSMAVFIPMTLPVRLTRGPPLFPLFIAASVCIKSYKVPCSVCNVRPKALTIPRVTVGPPFNAKAFPRAIIQSPTANPSESPNRAIGRPCTSILITARSVILSPPTICASWLSPLGRLTTISSASLTTW